jgi:kinesin family protein 2/24
MGLKFTISFFEIYGGRCYDLLNKQNKLNILEDKNQNVQIQGLEERLVGSADEMYSMIEYGNSVRTTHQTVANDTSSRSHAICQVSYTTKPEILRSVLRMLLVMLMVNFCLSILL